MYMWCKDLPPYTVILTCDLHNCNIASRYSTFQIAMDLNFSFSPSPNKRTRQAAGLDRLEFSFCMHVNHMMWCMLHKWMNNWLRTSPVWVALHWRLRQQRGSKTLRETCYQELCKRQSEKTRMRNHNLRLSLWSAAFQAPWKDTQEQMALLSAARPKQSGNESEKLRIQEGLSTTHLWWSSLTDLWTWPNLGAPQTIHCIQCAEPGCGMSLQTLHKLQLLDLPPLNFPVTGRTTWWANKFSQTSLKIRTKMR